MQARASSSAGRRGRTRRSATTTGASAVSANAVGSGSNGLDRRLDRGVVGDVRAGMSAISSPRQAPPSRRSAIWSALRRGFEERDGGRASRHRARFPPSTGASPSLVAAAADRPRTLSFSPRRELASRRPDRRRRRRPRRARARRLRSSDVGLAARRREGLVPEPVGDDPLERRRRGRRRGRSRASRSGRRGS